MVAGRRRETPKAAMEEKDEAVLALILDALSLAEEPEAHCSECDEQGNHQDQHAPETPTRTQPARRKEIMRRRLGTPSTAAPTDAVGTKTSDPSYSIPKTPRCTCPTTVMMRMLLAPGFLPAPSCQRPPTWGCLASGDGV